MSNYNHPEKKEYATYRTFGVVDLWNEFVGADVKVMKYLLGDKFTGAREAKKTSSEETKRFFEALEDSRFLLELLKQKSKKEIYSVLEYLKNKKYVAKDIEKAHLEGLVGLIEKELF